MKRFALSLVALAALSLSACSGDDEPKGSTPDNANTIKVADATVTTDKIGEGVSYINFTNDGDKALATLWFKTTSNPEKGTVDITRCTQEWDAKGECKSGAQTVLPNVDLAGWQFALASGSTNLGKGETAYLKFVVEGSSEDVAFEVSADEPKQAKN